MDRTFIKYSEALKILEENKTGIEIKASTVTDLTFLSEFAEGNQVRMQKYIALYLKLLRLF